MPPRCANPTSAAKLFVQLSTRRSIGANQSNILDVLLPPQTSAYHFGSTRHTQHRPTRNLRNPIWEEHFARRCFSSTDPRRKTQPIYNPQKDEDGNEMVLEITPRAANRLSQIMKKDNNPYLALRISVESGGCHGFQYLMSLTTLPSSLTASGSATPAPGNSPSSEAEAEVAPSTTTSALPAEPGLGEDDTILAFVNDEVDVAQEDEKLPATAPKIIMDAPSLELLKGSKVDFTMELIGSQFKIVDNPLATSSCGCGTSFDIKL